MGSLNERKRGEPGVEQRRKLGEAAVVALLTRCVGGFEVAPALVRTLRIWRDQLERRRKDDVDPPVLAIFKAKNFLAADQPVLDDPVDRTADQLVRALWPHARDHPDLAAGCPRRDALLKGIDGPAAKRDLGQMKLRHSPGDGGLEMDS